MKNKNYLKRLEDLLQEVLGNQDNDSFDSLLNKFGDFKTEKGVNELGDWVKTTFTSNDGSFTQVSYLLHGKPEKKEISSEIIELNQMLKKCVDKQDYEKAAELRDKIKFIEGNKIRIDELKKELDLVIKNHNFERAIEIRDELKKYETEQNGYN
jgi:protein-arginine kinase activator protein McsA